MAYSRFALAFAWRPDSMINPRLGWLRGDLDCGIRSASTVKIEVFCNFDLPTQSSG